MAKASKSFRVSPNAVLATVRRLGHHISIARRRRRISLRSMAERMSVSVGTVQRLERGDPKVSVGIVTNALWVLGLHRQLEIVADPEHDKFGISEEMRRLPKHVRRTSNQSNRFDF